MELTFRSYLKDKLYFLVVQAGAVFFVCFMLGVLGHSIFAVGFVAILLISANVFGFLFEYFKKRGFYHTVAKSLGGLNKKYLISELIDKPSFAEGEFLYETLKAAAKSMNDTVAEYKIASEEYREYIETWVHEVKTPISASKLIIENNLNEVTQSLSDELSKIDRFVEQALFYSKSNNVEKDYSIMELTLSDLVKNVVKKHSKALIESKTSVNLENLDLIVFADAKWMDFILGQIITNSIKYQSQNPKIVFCAQECKSSVLLSIHDNGIGISEKDINRVFDKGFTGENGRQYAKSTGIGLYLCKKLCSKMGLGITMSSEAGVGTTLNIIFPKGNTIITEL
ncbi:sensor histidine kinase [Oscillospiraceae bacterium PP1C4]